MLKKFFILVTCFLVLAPQNIGAKSKRARSTTTSIPPITALILAGEYEAALKQIKKAKGPKSFQKSLPWLEAYLNLQTNNFARAAKLFGDIEKKYPNILTYTHYYQARALRALKKPKAAIKLLKPLQSQKLNPAFQNKVMTELALGYCQLKKEADGLNLFNALIQKTANSIQQYQLRYQKSQCLLLLNKKAQARSLLQNLYLSFPEGDLSTTIRSELQQMGRGYGLSAEHHQQRAQSLIAKERYDLAAEDFRAAADYYRGDASIALKKQLALAHFKARQYPQAARLLAELSNQGALNKKEKESLAQAYSRSDQFDAAIRAYEDLLNYSDSRERPILEYKIAYLHMDKGDLKKANQEFTGLLAQYPRHQRRAGMHWFLAWNHYLLKNYSRALNYLNLLDANFSRSREARRVPYWRARILTKQGKHNQATQAYRRISERDPFSYYAFLSLKRLEKNWDIQNPPRSSWTKDLPRHRSPRSFSWEKLWKSKRSTLTGLLGLGLWEDFMDEVQSSSSNTPALSDLIQAIQYTSPPNYNPRGDWSNRYPKAYETLVNFFAPNRNFSTALSWAIMREESRFRPKVVSPAKAIGLMQIIPPTGFEISRNLKRQGFIPQNLYQPAVNIEYGIHYLSTNYKKFKGSLAETIASYNAGPHNVERWLKSRPNRDWDEFIEEIPYRETNHYVKKVLKSYYLYRLLYGIN